MEQDAVAPIGQIQQGVSAPEAGIILGRALATDRKRVVVATDAARGSRMMCEALVSGLVSQGADAVDAGCVPEPAAALAARLGDCSVYIKEEGRSDRFVLFNSDGSPFTMDKIRHMDTALAGYEPPDYRGLGRRLEHPRANEDYIAFVNAALGDDNKAPMVLDCTYGTASLVAPWIVGSGKSDAITINGHIDPDAWSDEDGEEEIDRSLLSGLVSSREGCIGAGFDRPGSRAAVFGEDGTEIDAWKAAALVIQHLKPAKVVAAADTSGPVEKACRMASESAEFILAPCSAGSVADAMIREDADLGICSAGIMYRGLPCPDPFRTVALIAETAYSGSLSRIAEDLGTMHRRSEVLPIGDDEDAFVRAMNAGTAEMSCERLWTAEGWRVDLDDGWFLVRPPEGGKAEILAESADKAYLIGLMEAAGDLVRTSSHDQ